MQVGVASGLLNTKHSKKGTEYNLLKRGGRVVKSNKVYRKGPMFSTWCPDLSLSFDAQLI
jgi:hypothetical protein